MRNKCNIIQDILPLYVENIVSDDTAEFVKEHLETCAECQHKYEQMKEPEVNHTSVEVAPLVNLKKKMLVKKVQTIALTAIFVIAVVLSAFAVLSAPVYFPYSEDLLSITENADESITITFAERVTDYSCSVFFDSDSENPSTEKVHYTIEAWTSLWDEWFSNRGVQSTTIRLEKNVPFTVYYAANNNEENIFIYGKSVTASGGSITLPRLTLGYYLILAIFGFCALLIAWFIFRSKPNIKIWIERFILYPVSYIIGHFIVSGMNSTSYSLERDFMLIIFLSILIYSGMLLARSLYLLRKEINSTNLSASL